MDLASWLGWSTLGLMAGVVTGLIPGLHVNTLAGLLIAFGTSGAAPATAAVAMGISHTFVGIIPATYLGAPDDDAPVSVLPAHRLMKQGRGRGAVRLSLHASLASAVLTVALVWPYSRVAALPAVQGWLTMVTPWLLILVLAWMVQRAAKWWTVVCMALAGGLGLAASGVGMLPLVDVPSSGLLPLLGGLFGASGLLVAMQHASPAPEQETPPSVFLRAPDIFRGVAAASGTAIVPGVTSATASCIACPGEAEPESFLSTVSSVDTAHAIFALGLLWAILRGRTGLALAVDAWIPIHRWDGQAPDALLWIMATALLAAIGAAALGTILEGSWARVMPRLNPRLLAAVVLAAIGALVVILCGLPGALVFCAAAAIGFLCVITGTPRIVLTAALIVPTIAWTLP